MRFPSFIWPSPLVLTGVFTSALFAQPALYPGEGLAAAGPDGIMHTFGDADTCAPMGSLAKLVWLRLEGEEWLRQRVSYHCTGTRAGQRCWHYAGHGDLDLPKALAASCNLAFLQWIDDAQRRWTAILGADAARARVETAFAPFLPFVPQRLLALGPPWIGDGTLLCTSPKGMLTWLLQPTQKPLLARCQAWLTLPGETWWMKTGTAPSLQGTRAWVAGGNGHSLAVLHLPKGRGKVEGMARFRALMETPDPPTFKGDPDARLRLGQVLQSALTDTSIYGPWPTAPWHVHLHQDNSTFDKTTGALPACAACWLGHTLHLRPWDTLRQRDLNRLLRHEMTHRRLLEATLPAWEEEARCLHAEQHAQAPDPWPAAPSLPLQQQLNAALRQGSPQQQVWAYGALRQWLAGQAIAPLTLPAAAPAPLWQEEATISAKTVRVTWPPERMPQHLTINGEALLPRPGKTWHFTGTVRFNAESPCQHLVGQVDVAWGNPGWHVTWTLPCATWIAAATAGELGEDAPFEAKRALAAVLREWLAHKPQGNHRDGSLCPLTHCAVVRNAPSLSSQRAADTAPALSLSAEEACFCGSKGGVSLSPRQVWGGGSVTTPTAAVAVPQDRWGTWSRQLSAHQAQTLKNQVSPGVTRGQQGIRLGRSGPYAVESLRIAAGRLYGWTTWPSNACEAVQQPDGSVTLTGHGWGHNVGLCLATACYRAKQGWKAEAILAEAFGSAP